MSENEEVAKLVDGAYKNILEKFNPCARQLISAGKAYLKALHGAVAASKAYIDALSKLARHAHQGTWGGCTDIGTALMQLVDVQKEIESQQLNILKAFYVDLLVPLESNIDKDTKIVACEQKRFLQQHKCLQESFLKAAATVKKQRKKNRTHRATNIEKEIKNIHVLEEEKMKLDCFCERSLKQAIIQERRRFGFVLERQCSLTKHNLVYHSQGQNLLQHRLEEWEDVAKSRESLPEPIDKLFPSTNNYKICGEYASANILGGPTPSSLCVPGVPQGGGGTLRKTRSIDASCMDLREAPNDPYPRPLTRAKSDFNIASSSASLVSDDYGNHRVTLRSKGLVDGDSNSVRIKVRALYSYLSSGEHQLSFHEGDTIALIGNRNKGWQYGENQRNHRCGWFPIAYTEALRDNCNIGNNLDGSSELKRHSMDFSKPYSNSVTRSKTTPNIQPYECGIDTTSSEYASSHSSPLSSDSLPPAPTVQRPLSTFIDSCAARHFESLQQHLRLGPCPRLVHSTTGPTIGDTTSSAATPTSPTSGDPPLMSDALLRRFHPRQQKPSQHCPLLPQHPASLHSSNDSGFCNEPPSLPLPTTGLLKQLDQVDSARPKENIFSAVKLRKVVTNDRSAPMIS